jgi:cobalt-zinc-cadmium efflux system outer membrane protein
MQVGIYQLLTTRQSQTSAFREYIETVRDYWVARSDLERAIGGPIQEQAALPMPH